MGARHRMSVTPEQRPRAGALRRSGVATVCEVASAAMLCAAACAALVLNVPHSEKRTIEASQEPPAAAQPVRQVGTVIAVSAGSVTARSANGYTQTYLVTPNTTLIGHGGQSAAAATHFTVNDRVEIVGTIQDGAVLATAVADRDAGRGDGPPMDYLDGQIVPAGRT
ncbi:hypothetical protein A5756_15090 [Mycobacterium sp. 852002-53434_SCH5985345]|nr:hypothetical protein A5756_15090 [Mycobacterium sp. 852002-53434_SCH5985345]OBF74266.1 hypothetical protein A5750_00710 [Mycobacterium sp. 852002-51613_SCH5001154]OBF91726.1 hypothetical protein A5773_22630 [Mycobacterium sp. 852014-52450_SCH5900713]